MFKKYSNFTLYWGDATTAITPANYEGLSPQKIITKKPFGPINSTLQTTSLFFPRQTHGTTVLQYDEDMHTKNFTIIGDAIVTNKPGCAIGVVTADCSPIVLCDQVNHVAAFIHASWKTSAAHILQKTVLSLCNNYGTKTKNLLVFFGPSARSCCYKIKNDLIEKLDPIFYNSFNVLKLRKNKLYLDLVSYNTNILVSLGVQKKNICAANATCTICNLEYCSYRRENKSVLRQVSIIALN